MLDLCNSGDTAGGKDRVVGYASFAFDGDAHAYTDQQGKRLLDAARASIASALDATPAPIPGAEPWLREYRASFVTLKQNQQLRGCIGMLEASRPLGSM